MKDAQGAAKYCELCCFLKLQGMEGCFRSTRLRNSEQG